MKQFRVTEIITTDDGRVILNGPSGSIDIQRHGDKHSSAHFSRFQYNPISPKHGDHAEKVQNIPQQPDKYGMCGSIAF